MKLINQILLISMLGLFLVVGGNTFAESTVELSGKDLKAKTVQEVADLYGVDAGEYALKIKDILGVKVKTTDSFQTLHDNYGAEPSEVKAIAEEMQANILGVEYVPEEEPADSGNAEKAEKEYYLFPIALIMTLIYVVSFYLSRIKKITLLTHKKVWNALLFFTFGISAILGILLVLRITYDFVIPLPFNMLFWHVEAGIAMSIISVFHIIWHWPYFKTYLPKN